MDRFARAEQQFESAHGEDPDTSRGEPWSVIYHRRLACWVDELSPNASVAMRLAARCQHVRRWKVPRSNFPTGVTGYKQWRAHLAQFHASEAATILEHVGYDEPTVSRVRDYLIKKALHRDPDMQTFEDAVCLTFIENQLDDFASKHQPDKLISVVQKTWAKMSSGGHDAVKVLMPTLSPEAQSLLGRALADA